MRKSLLLVCLVVVYCTAPVFAFDAATITRVVDGDTLEVSVDGHLERVRLIGVDTPEVYESDKLHRDAERTHQDEGTIRALGEQASNYVKGIVHKREHVQLEYGQQRRDRYARLLAFVWLPDGRMLNETIVCEGYSPAFTRYPFRQDYMDRFRSCERQAREAGKGLWAAEGARESAPTTAQGKGEQGGVVHGNRRSLAYHLPTCPDYDRLSPQNIVPFQTEAEALQAGYHKAGNCR